MKFRNLFLLSFLLLLSTLISCNKNPKFKVGILMDDTLQERWLKDEAFLKNELKNINGEVTVRWAYGNEDAQYTQALELLREGAEVLIVIPVNLEAAAAIVAEAHKQDVKVLAYDRLIKNCDLDFYVSFDNVQVGFMQAQYCTNLVPNGKYAIINGPTKDNNSFLLQLGQMAYLQPLVEKGDVEILYQTFAKEWSIEEGHSKFIEAIEDNDSIQAFICGNDALALGAIQAYKEVDSTLSRNLLFTGQDADLENCKLILEGVQSMTVYKSIKQAAAMAASIAQALALSHPVEIENLTSINNNKLMVPTVLISPVSIDKSNLKETLVNEGFLKEEDLQ